ncbi:MAG: hypothetical protein GYA87_02870 [Christensenellaceae bacterium]|nr:hypothetical protein [Christensenellaceae bacterium]
MAYAGLDIGTSSSKVTVYDISGNTLFSSIRYYDEIGGNGIRELDPNTVVENVLDLLKELGNNCKHTIKGMAITSLGESLVFIDEKNNVICNSFLTGDFRGIEESEYLINNIGQERIMNITGLPPNELYSLPKLIWFKNNTDVLKRSKKIFFFEDYIAYLLTKKRIVSYSSACRSMAFDIVKKEWSDYLLSLAGINHEFFSQPVESGTLIGNILPDIAESLNLSPDMKIYAGGHDQMCAALGSGLIDEDTCETSMGTCEFMLFLLPALTTTKYMIENDFTCIPYVLPNKYLSSLEVTTCGILKNWGKQTLSYTNIDNNDNNFFDKIEDEIINLQTEVLTLPQFGSSGNPNLSMDARGTVTGLTIHTKPEEIYLSLIEGMSFQLLLAYEKLKAIGVSVNKMVATGGGAASDATLQIRANIFNMPVYRTESKETGALGAMILAAYGAGEFPSLHDGIDKIVKYSKKFEPNSKTQDYYLNKYEKYKHVYSLMHDYI